MAQCVSPCFEFGHLFPHGRGRDAVKERLHQPDQIALRLVQRFGIRPPLSVVLGMQAVHGARVFLAKDFGARRLHEAVLQAVEHSPFQIVAPHGSLVIAVPLLRALAQPI